jgi:hypothetical protein
VRIEEKCGISKKKGTGIHGGIPVPFFNAIVPYINKNECQ